MSDYLTPSEMPRFLSQIKELQRAQSDMIRVFETGRKRGWLNSDELRDYNRQMADYKRNLADVERQTKAIQRAKSYHHAGIAGREAIGLAPTDQQLRKQERYVQRERELVKLKKEAGRELAIAERRQKSIERMGQAGAQRAQAAASQERWDEAKNRAGRWARRGFAAGKGLAGWVYNQLMNASHLHTDYEMARSGTERMGGVFDPGYSRKRTVAEKISIMQRGFKDAETHRNLRKMRNKMGFWTKARLNLEGAFLDDWTEIKDPNEVLSAATKKANAKKRIPGGRAHYEGYGMSLGYSIQESHQLAQMGLRSLPSNRLQDMKSNLAMFRGYSLDPNALTGFHRAARGVGYEGGAQVLNRELISAFTKGKFPRALMGEFVSSATQVLNTMQSGGGVVKAGSAANLLSVFSQAMGRGYRGDPARTAQFMGAFHRGIQSPGGGDPGNAFQMRAFGLGQPGVSMWDIYRRQDQGLNYKNVKSILDYGTANYGTQNTKYILRSIYNLKAPAIDALMEGYKNDKLSPAEYNRIIKINQNAEFGEAGKYRAGFRPLELKKMAEQAQIAAKSVAAVTAAYEFQTRVARATADGIEWLTGHLSWLLRITGLKVSKKKTK